MASNGAHIICRRCDLNPATQNIRSEQVCRNCFTTYVTTKAIKRMETYRVRGSTTKAARKLLFPLSFGPSSASLLHILDGHLQGQYDRMNRAAYELIIVHVEQQVESVDRDNSTSILVKYKSRYPRHTYMSIGLEEALSLEGVDWTALGVSRFPTEDNSRPATEHLQQVIGSLPSATSRADVLSTLLTRLLVDVAKRHDCESILLSDSTTKLAEKTLTETAKGRGFSLPWQVSDGQSPYGIGFNYPMRDLLKKELVAFSTLVDLGDLVTFDKPSTSISASSKSTTIDDLMAQYFETVEENYPSIVANVVRTSSKLKPLASESTTACSLCGLPVEEGTDGIYGWGGDQNSTARPTSHSILCYGCSRSVNG